MTTPNEYRQFAEECFKWAKRAKSDEERETLLDMANTWMQAASIQEQQNARRPERYGATPAKSS
jgi:hypothetical protein